MTQIELQTPKYYGYTETSITYDASRSSAHAIAFKPALSLIDRTYLETLAIH
jgi:hypothetical protein